MNKRMKLHRNSINYRHFSVSASMTTAFIARIMRLDALY